MLEAYRKTTEEMLSFIKKSPSAFHAVDNISKDLSKEGFIELHEEQAWELEMGKGYYVVRNDSSIIAFTLPEEALGFHIVASHSDSPAFKIKENPEMKKEEYVTLNTEKYGGMILSSWMDRPLSIAGRLAVLEKGKIITKLVHIDHTLVVIPNLAIHMNRDMNKGIEYNPQVDMLPLFSGKDGCTLLSLMAKEANVEESDIIGHDLFLCVNEDTYFCGAAEEFILSPRLDDLQCVYASYKAFKESKGKDYVNVCAVFDNEEVGSATRQGADSTFLRDVLGRISCGIWKEQKGLAQAAQQSFLISADNAHGVHPNHPEKADPTNRPYLNGGLVIKYHGSQKYTTDGVSAAKMKAWCKKAEVPVQTYANRSDILGGSTLGNISATQISIPSVDVGLPQLAMHSAMETAGAMDTEYAVRAFKAFYEE
ncbi:M18 family aminopeptidase [Lachnospiraceae bacterium OttesenSCG-928-D06]|nr:M18 family aminopeptidase [Lachnospiraceae bacterium OttesenSCG-928-D06]